jgi:hypothetical protein
VIEEGADQAPLPSRSTDSTTPPGSELSSQTTRAVPSAPIAPGEDRELASHPAVCWKIDGFRNEAEGVVDADSCAIVLGHRAIEQSCSWKPATRAAIAKGWEELRASLKVGGDAASG